MKGWIDEDDASMWNGDEMVTMSQRQAAVEAGDAEGVLKGAKAGALQSFYISTRNGVG